MDILACVPPLYDRWSMLHFGPFSQEIGKNALYPPQFFFIIGKWTTNMWNSKIQQYTQ